MLPKERFARRPSSRGKLPRTMRKQNLPLQRPMNHESILSVATSLGYPDVGPVRGGGRRQLAQNVVNRLMDNLGGGDAPREMLPRA